eukprot:c20785_g1_i1 orf=171-509(+)
MACTAQISAWISRKRKIGEIRGDQSDDDVPGGDPVVGRKVLDQIVNALDIADLSNPLKETGVMTLSAITADSEELLKDVLDGLLASEEEELAVDARSIVTSVLEAWVAKHKE